MKQKQTMRNGVLVKSLALMAAALLGAAGSARGGFNDDWDYKASLTFSGYSGTETLTNFPVLVNLASFSGFAYSQVSDAAGGDLRFADANGAELNFEIESWNPSGDTFVWVQVPALTNNAAIIAYWGNDAATLPVYATDGSTWSNGYVAVYHLSETSGTCGDSSPQANTLTLKGNTTLGSAGKVGLSPRLPDGNNDWLEAADHGSLEGMGQLTLEAWIYDEQNDSNARAIISKRTSSNSQISFYLFKFTNRSISFSLGNSGGTAGLGGEFSGTATDANRWYHVAATYDKDLASNRMKVFLDGVYKSARNEASGNVTPTTSALRLGILNADYGNAWKGKLDEVRLANVARSADWLAATHKTIADNAGFADYGIIEAADPTMPVLAADPAISLTESGDGFVVSAELASGEADLFAVFGPEEPFAYTNLLGLGVEAGIAVSNTLSGLPADRMLSFGVLATNASGHAVFRASPEPFMSGEVSIAGTADAYEENSVHGTFTLTRPATATNLPLTVSYAVSGSADPGVNYVALSGTATFPVGAASVAIDVTPLLEAANASDTTLTLSLEPGLYFIGEGGEASITIQSLDVPAAYNVWIAPAAGNASEAANWSQGVPTSDDDILLGVFSSAGMTWDAGVNGLPDTVASWTQTADYTGTVTFPIQYPSVAGATFTNFTVTGNAVVDGGSWTHPGNYASSGATTALSQKTYRLYGTVGGSFALGAAATLNATGRGFGYSGSSGQPAPSHGGLVHGGATTTYGSVYQPEDLGKGGLAQSDQKSKPSALGGGAIRLVVSGTATIDGTIAANGTADQNISRVGGSGGSIWITADQVSGTGSMSAGGAVAGTDWTIGVGSGGRIAIETASPLSFSTDSLFVDGESYSATQSKTSGCGTIFLMDDTQTHGTLLIKQSATCHLSGRAYSGSHRTNVTPVNPGETWTFDRIITSGFGRLCVPEGATLVLPNGLSSVTSADTSLRDGLVYAGGMIDLGAGATQTLAEGVNFQPASSFTLDGDLVLSDSSGLGVFTSVFGTYAEVNPACLLTVNGDLSVPTSARVSVASAFYENITSADALRGAHGGRSLYNTATNLTYGSILNPVAAGTSRARGFFGAGVIDLVVSGQLLLDGPMSAIGMQPRGSDSTWDNSPAGSGGSISVRTGTLAGNGTISAEGGCSRYNYAGGAGGGRIAIRLTSPGATFETFGTDKIGAKGISFAGADQNAKASSAGTVYLQVAAAAEAAGEVRIVNDDGVYNTCTTPYPGVGAGCDTPSALKRTSLFVGGLARVELTHGLYLANGELAAGSSIDLKGKTLSFRNLSLNGDAVPGGQYAYDHSAVAGFFADSVGGGSVVVLGVGTVVVIR